MLALWHVHQVLDRVPQPIRQPGRDALEQVLHGMGDDGSDETPQRARRRQHDPCGAEQVLGQCQQRPGQHVFERALLEPGAQPLFGGMVELVPAQVSADTLELGGLGRGPYGIGQGQHRFKTELLGEVVHRFGRRAPVVDNEVTGGAQRAELDGATQAVLGAARTQRLGRVRRSQRPKPWRGILTAASP